MNKRRKSVSRPAKKKSGTRRVKARVEIRKVSPDLDMYAVRIVVSGVVFEYPSVLYLGDATKVCLIAERALGVKAL